MTLHSYHKVRLERFLFFFLIKLHRYVKSTITFDADYNKLISDESAIEDFKMYRGISGCMLSDKFWFAGISPFHLLRR